MTALGLLAVAALGQETCSPDVYEPSFTFEAGVQGATLTNWYAAGGCGDVRLGTDGSDHWITAGVETCVLSGPDWYFSLPLLLRNPAFAGGMFSLEVRRAKGNPTNCADCADVVLYAQNGGVQVRLDPPVSDAWRTYDIPLDATGGWEADWRPDRHGPPATDADIRSALGALTTIFVRADAPGEIELDDVRMTLPPSTDADGDGFHVPEAGGDDCDDADPDVHPCATDAWYDGVDTDCDGANDLDADRDGYDAAEADGPDCDDEDPAVQPDAWDRAGDGVDADCDGVDGSASASGGCGCGGGSPTPGAWGALVALVLRRRRAC